MVGKWFLINCSVLNVFQTCSQRQALLCSKRHLDPRNFENPPTTQNLYINTSLQLPRAYSENADDHRHIYPNAFLQRVVAPMKSCVVFELEQQHHHRGFAEEMHLLIASPPVALTLSCRRTDMLMKSNP